MSRWVHLAGANDDTDSQSFHGDNMRLGTDEEEDQLRSNTSLSRSPSRVPDDVRRVSRPSMSFSQSAQRGIAGPRLNEPPLLLRSPDPELDSATLKGKIKTTIRLAQHVNVHARNHFTFQARAVEPSLAHRPRVLLPIAIYSHLHDPPRAWTERRLLCEPKPMRKGEKRLRGHSPSFVAALHLQTLSNFQPLNRLKRTYDLKDGRLCQGDHTYSKDSRWNLQKS
ncbi:hypothetical protein BKA62DRAFT_3 [Auriculariales sp. MPI-PUGE-AT-0066]|nr:hypothetical protein BKA62DRAFT_3 [Auriculariales sp. MPI-PUGE-AT-0066]